MGSHANLPRRAAPRPAAVRPHRFLALGVALLALTAPATVGAAGGVPAFRSAAAARAWGEQKERLGQFQLAGEAYEREAALRAAAGDRQGAEVERRRARRLETDLALAIPAPVTGRQTLARLEPETGCYLGVLDGYPGGLVGNADSFARRIRRPVAVAFEYDSYGQRFPLAWARYQASQGRAVQIAWEPSRGLDAVRDDAYLAGWARDAARSGAAVFLRFAGEMNGGWTVWGRDPAAYRRAFRLVHAVMSRYAPNVALVWAPNAVPVSNLDAYYPGDDAVDWVGISLYLVRYYDDNLSRPAWQDHPLAFIEPFYRKYAARKPLCLVECGISRRSRVEGRDADAFAAARIQDLFDALRVRFPRLKMVCWFDRNNLTGAPSPERRLNDYSLPEGSGALASFRSAAADPYFLGRFGDSARRGYRRLRSSRLPDGYRGEVVGSLSTYALFPVLEVTRGGASTDMGRPYRFTLPPGRGPVTLRVRDPGGHPAATLSLTAP